MTRWTVLGVRDDGRIVRDVIEAPHAELAPLMMRVDGTDCDGGDWRVLAVFEGDIEDELRLDDATRPNGVPLVASYRDRLAARNRAAQEYRDRAPVRAARKDDEVMA